MLLWQCWLRFGEGWGLGARHSSAFTPLAESVSRSGRRSPRGACSRSAGTGRCGITLQRAAPATSLPSPSLGRLLPQHPAWHPFSGQGPWCAKRVSGDQGSRRLQTDSHERRGPRTVEPGACGEPASQTWEADRLRGRWAPQTSSLSSSSLVLRTDELFIRITHSWKCELASSSYTPTESSLAVAGRFPDLSFQQLFAAPPLSFPQVHSSYSLATQPLPHVPTPVPPFVCWLRILPFTCGSHQLVGSASHLPCLEPFCLESLSQGVQ